MDLKQELIKFKITFDRILSVLLDDDHGEFKDTYLRLRRMIEYNVPHGKLSRGLAVVHTFRLIEEQNNNPIDEEELELARVLGWALEFLQACCLMLDDIMDQTSTRRGLTCWYKLADVGLSACNDALIIEQECYRIIKLFFSDKPYYIQIFELMHKITLLTAYGQQLDISSNPPKGSPQFSLFNKFRYNNIAKYKTAFYSFVLPIRLAIYMSSITLEEEHKNAEEILLRIGLLFQIQDDFLDCWGDPNIMGKTGTDIEEGKCCWPIVTALSLANETQLQVLKNNYGIKDSDSVLKVKDIYNELKIKDLFFTEETQLYIEINQMINDLRFKSQLNPAIFKTLLDHIYKRQK